MNVEAEKRELDYEYDNIRWVNGIELSELEKECGRIENELAGEPKSIIKANIQKYILENAQVEAAKCRLFPYEINHGGIIDKLTAKWLGEICDNEMKGMLDEYSPLQKSFTFTADVDFGHTCPQWSYIMKYGFSRMLENVRKYSDGDTFYTASEMAYMSIIKYIGRLADATANDRYADEIRALTVQPPKTFYQAMEMIILYYTMQQYIDRALVRSIGLLDTTLYPFYKNDIENGTITEDEARRLIKCFFYELHQMKAIANIPFALCGSDEDGNDLTNPLTHILLEEYIALDVDDPKIHIRYHKDIDPTVIDTVLKSIRSGKNSFVFMNDRIAEKGLEKIGIEKKDARNYAIVGCYEPSAEGEVACSCNGRINIPKAVELAMSGGVDLQSGETLVDNIKIPDSYDELYANLIEILKLLSDGCCKIISGYERYYMQVCPSPIFSGAMEHSVKNGVDIYAGGAKYNNSSINAIGLATAVDSLAAIKKLVFEDKTVSLSEMTEALRNDWKGAEKLKLMCRACPKYGNNNAEIDGIAMDICQRLGDFINDVPNGRNGKFRLGLFSIDWRFEFGSHTAASADGRNNGETISKNMCAVMGCDKKGITSLINTVTKIDYTRVPNGTVLDASLSHTAVSGEDGLMAMRTLLLTFLRKGGIAIQFNVLNPDVLKKAQKNPDKYRHLQVRLCGWNVYFVDLSKKEQDEFIQQAELLV